MSDDQPTRPDSHASASASDSSGLKGLTTALGIEPAMPGYDPLLGCDIGGVKIVRLIAEGGMGRVYEGKQEKPNRTVAVKVMRPGLTSPSVLKRFEYEAEVLGRLQHPGIAHIYSVGMHRVGNASVPYFVMEYIADAKTLTQYAKDLKLPTRQRLDLFWSVCDAVAHGHQKGVIHRDLKPSNILVDATGQPKVIDFGVARATDSDMALTTMQTDVGQLLGTLQYMSPEQFDANPNDIDIRSDVYALGVVLYELLAGKPPYDVKKKAIFEVARIVKEEDPKPLSSFNRALKGDVAVIAGKCLEKDRGRRYSSASELGADIGRHLTGEPIAANPPGFIDGLMRLARKHRAATAAALVGFLGLAATVVGTSFFAVRADRQRQLAVMERDRANAAESELKSQLYEANVSSIDRLLRDGCRQRTSEPTDPQRRAQALVAPTKQLFGASAVPFEFACMLTQFDGVDNALFGHLSPTIRHDFGPDCKQLATAHWDGTVRVWHLEGSSRAPLTIRGPTKGAIYDVFFSGDGRRIAAREKAWPKPMVIWVWDSLSGTPLTAIEYKDASIDGGTALSHDGHRLAIGEKDAGITLWDVASKEKVGNFRVAAMPIGLNAYAYPAFSVDGSRLAANIVLGTSQWLAVWDVATGEELLNHLPGHLQYGTSSAPPIFSADGTKLAVCRRRAVQIIDIESKKELRVIDFGQERESQLGLIAFSADGANIASVKDGHVRVWDAATGKEVVHFTSLVNDTKNVPHGRHIAFSADGSRVVTWPGDATVYSWKIDTAEERTERSGLHGAVTSVAFSPDGLRLATSSWDNTVRLWNSVSGEEIAVLTGHADIVNSVAFSPDGLRLASASGDGTLRLWDCLTGQMTATFTADGKRAFSVSFSHDGTHLAGGWSDGRARIWHLQSGRQSKVLEVGDRNDGGRSPAGATQVAFSSDGRYFAASRKGATRVWETVNGNQSLELKQGGRALAFSPDGSRLITLGSFQVWKLPTGEAIPRPMNLPSSFLDGLAVGFSADGSLAAVCSSYGQAEEGPQVRFVFMDTMNVRLGVSYGQPARFPANSLRNVLVDASSHFGNVTSVAFSPDRKQLATGSRDGTARLWGRTSAEIRAARAEVQAIRGRLQPQVDSWFARGPKTAVQRMLESKPKLSPDEYREAANMVLKRCVAERSDQH